MPFEIFSACQEADEDGQGKDDHLTTDDQTSHWLAGSSGLSLVGWIIRPLNGWLDHQASHWMAE